MFIKLTSQCCFIFIFWFGGQDKKQKAAKGQNKDVQESQGGQSILGNTQDAIDGEEEVKQERVITLGPLNMQDFKEAKNQVTPTLTNKEILFNGVFVNINLGADFISFIKKENIYCTFVFE